MCVTISRASFALGILLVLFTGCVFFDTGSSSLLREAEVFLRQGKHTLAIEKYRAHIEVRRAEPTRPSWENPYFYYLLIGDVYLKDGDLVQALAAYETAEGNNVETVLVTDRYRSVANWYHDHGRSEEALRFLEANRERDSLLFDAMMDRIAKEIVRAEESSASNP